MIYIECLEILFIINTFALFGSQSSNLKSKQFNLMKIISTITFDYI